MQSNFDQREVLKIRYVLIGILYVLIVGIISFIYRKRKVEVKLRTAKQRAQDIVEQAHRDAQNEKDQSISKVQTETARVREELDREIKSRRSEIQQIESRLLKKKENLDKHFQAMEQREDGLKKKALEVQEIEVKVGELKAKQTKAMERISGITMKEAREYLLRTIRNDVDKEATAYINDSKDRTKEEAERKAKEIITTAIQKCVDEHISEAPISTVQLPNDEMKGRIIGREGRNIRALEALTGVEFIIDQIPEAVVLSGTNQISKEIGRMALEKLIADGRINPNRIEEVVEKSKKDMENIIKKEGEQACHKAGVHGVHPEILKLLGRLKYRTSYGQNVLYHSLEVSYLAGFMAAELGVDVKLARRAGLLHDIGKALNYEIEGTHVTIGADIAQKYKESNDVINAILSHHDDVEATSIVSVLVKAADAISGARPGARRQTLETYIEKIEKLEQIANSFVGVEKSFALQAGREIRILVNPEDVNDMDMERIAKEMVKRIENELEYPGQIKVNLIREVRAIEFAR